MSESPTIAGSGHGCTIRVIPTDTDYVQITAEYENDTAETTSIPKNRWVGRSGLKQYATDISDQLDADFDVVHEVLNDVRIQALLAWNWKTFMQVGAVTAPSFEHLRSLTVPDEQTGDYPTTEEVRDTLSELVEDTMETCTYPVCDSPTGSGKSYKISTTRWLDKPDVTGGRQVVHLSPTQNARDDAVKHSKKAGLDYYVLLGREEACPICRGDHDPDGKEDTITVDGEPVSEWVARMCNGKSLSLHDAKAILLEEADQGLDHIPCGGENSKCPASEQWKDIRDSIDGEPEYDVIHATHKFSFALTLRHKNNVAFDEQPSFYVIGPGDMTGGRTEDGGLDSERVKNAVTALLDDANVDIDTAEELMSVAKREASDAESSMHLRDRFPEVYDLFNHRPGKEWYYHHPDAHTAASTFAELLWDAARQPDDANGRRHAKMRYVPPSLTKTSENPEIVNVHRASVVINNNNTITTLRIGPCMSNSRSVIGLDAHPNQKLWELNVGPAMDVEKLMSDKERRLWRRYERRLLTIQVGNSAYSYTSEERYDTDKNRVLVETLREQYGEDFRTAVAPIAAEDNVRRALVGAGVDDFGTMHHGNVQSRNGFQGERIGAELGCIDPGDDYILDLLAELGLDATVERKDTLCDSCSGDGCNQCNQSGHQRAFGRGFVGEDSQAAESLLESVRANEVAQSIGRYARKADDPDDWAAVFTRTTAVPDNMVDFEGPRVWKYKDKQKAIAAYFQEHTEGTAKGVKEWIDNEYDAVNKCTKRHVHDTVTEHVKDGNIEEHEGVGYNGATVYEWTATDTVSKHGGLKFEITEVDHSENQTTTAEAKSGAGVLRSE